MQRARLSGGCVDSIGVGDGRAVRGRAERGAESGVARVSLRARAFVACAAARGAVRYFMATTPLRRRALTSR
ncbi:hypothetical protein [Lysobacter gummosus]|uniref:hypothetical protein n=1 Tax=Lysobacter gummosus TaxID=262324 RepID=UPI0036341E9F